MANNIMKSFTTQVKLILSIASIIAVLICSIIILDKCNGSDSQMKIEETPISIDSIIPKGDLYIGSAVIEDYVVKRKKEKIFGGLSSKNHTCVQIVKQKCHYKINLENIQYSLSSGDTIYAKLPPLEYVATTQDSPFLSDDEEYWAKELPSTNELKKLVEKKIKSQFDTKENKKKANLYAQESVSNLLGKLGYTVIFVNTIEKKIE